jgi:hypothetical protein
VRSGSHLRGVRTNALWGSSERGGGGTRGNALWGSAKRRIALLTALALVLVVPLDASAAPAKVVKADAARVFDASRADASWADASWATRHPGHRAARRKLPSP